jgi:hypothetical protein
MLRNRARAASVLAVLFTTFGSGCIGNIRETTTARTSTELLLISTAAERAIRKYEAPELKGKRVAIDDTKFDSVDKPYVMSALRHHLAESLGCLLVPVTGSKGKDKAGKEIDIKPDRVVEIRNGALGIYDKSWGFGIPPLPLPIPQTNITSVSPSFYFLYRGKQDGWAKFQLWVFDPSQDSFVSKSPDLWGHTYHSKWWFFGLGPFDVSNDIYPDEDLLDAAMGVAK